METYIIVTPHGRIAVMLREPTGIVCHSFSRLDRMRMLKVPCMPIRSTGASLANRHCRALTTVGPTVGECMRICNQCNPQGRCNAAYARMRRSTPCILTCTNIGWAFTSTKLRHARLWELGRETKELRRRVTKRRVTEVAPEVQPCFRFRVFRRGRSSA